MCVRELCHPLPVDLEEGQFCGFRPTSSSHSSVAAQEFLLVKAEDSASPSGGWPGWG